MKRTAIAALAACCLLASLTGCGTMKTKWRETRKLYREYVNTDPSIDFSDEGISDKGLQRLAASKARLSAPAIGLEVVLEGPGVAVRVAVVADGAAVLGDGLGQHLDEGREEPCAPGGRDQPRGRVRPDAREGSG